MKLLISHPTSIPKVWANLGPLIFQVTDPPTRSHLLASLPSRICAFSINQHASICGGFGPAPDDPEAFRHFAPCPQRRGLPGAGEERVVSNWVVGMNYRLCKHINIHVASNIRTNQFDDRER